MTTWRIEPFEEPAPPVDRRRGFMRALAVAVAALLMANSVIVAEQVTGRDLFDLFTDGVRDARAALARALDPNQDTQVLSGVEDTTTSTTGPEASSTTTTAAPATTDTTVAPATSETTTAPAIAPPATVPAANSFETAVAQLSAFVEKERGLKFKTPVTIAHLDDNAFKSRLSAQRLTPATEQARQAQGVMRTLGLIAPDVDLAAQVSRLSSGNVSAFYDPARNELVVRGGDPSPFVKKILVHELVHALNDQYYELDRPDIRGSLDDSSDAFEALMEGIASRVEERYVASLSAAEKSAIDSEQRRLAAQIPRDLPQVVLVSFGFPYTAGLRLANALMGAGGNARLNAALQGPPSTTEQVLRPEKYAAGEGMRDIAAPPADGPVVRQGVLGQLMLSLMLAEVLEAGYAEAAADGWGGDRYVAWQNGGQTCVRLAISMDTPEESAELGEGLADWASERPGAVVEGTGPFTVTRCA